jgi:hypothetical protein
MHEERWGTRRVERSHQLIGYPSTFSNTRNDQSALGLKEVVHTVFKILIEEGRKLGDSLGFI